MKVLAFIATLALAALETKADLSSVWKPYQPFHDQDVVPMQTRLAYAGCSGMTVSWNTYKKIDRPTVFYGLTPWTLFWVAQSGDSVTYPTSWTYNNHVKLEGLRPNTKYYFLPIYSNTSVPSSFKTSREAGDHTAFVAAGVVDMGTMGPLGLATTVGKGAGGALAPGERNTIQALTAAKDQYDFIIHPGDIACADYWLKEELQGYLPNTTLVVGAAKYEQILNAYYDELAPITTAKPYLVAPRNHDSNCDNGGSGPYNVPICLPGQTNFTGFINHWRMPSPESGGLGNFWYSYDYGMTHFISINSETDLGNGLAGPDGPGTSDNSGPFGSYQDEQIDWIKNDLAKVDRRKTPWVVAMPHRPWYVSTSACTVCQQAFEDVLYQAKVDLVYTGHFHATERNAPTYQNKSDPAELNNPQAPWYITNGAAGHYDGLDAFKLPLKPYPRFAQNSTYGWSRFTFHNKTHLTHELISSANGAVLDSATLYKQR